MSDEKKRIQPLFEGLIFDENQQPVELTYIGLEPHYVVLDDDFRRHIATEYVDRQVIEWLQKQIFANKDAVTAGVMSMMGKDDLFTKAMIDSSVKNIDQVLETGIPGDARMWLGMMGFKVIIDIHGDMVDIDAPAQPDDLPPGFFGGE